MAQLPSRAATQWVVSVLGALVLAVVALAYAQRLRPRPCHPIGCFDGFTARIDAGPRGMPRGPHEVIVIADGAARSCSFFYDEYAASVGPSSIVSCAPGAGVGFAHVICDQRVQRDCPAAGFESESVSVSGKPASVRIIQIVNRKVIFDREVRPQYQTGDPNRGACHVCTSAGAIWSVD